MGDIIDLMEIYGEDAIALDKCFLDVSTRETELEGLGFYYPVEIMHDGEFLKACEAFLECLNSASIPIDSCIDITSALSDVLRTSQRNAYRQGFWHAVELLEEE